MIELTNINGQRVYFAPEAIAQVTEAGASSQWHGIRAIVRTFDKRTVEVQESAAAIAEAMRKAVQG